MLRLHHLNNSRSQRILWALEELNQPYELVRYQREANMLAPEALKKVHPLGKSPVLEDNGHTLIESGAILEYLQETYDTQQQFRPANPEERVQYRIWLHYAEGSLMPLMLMKLVLTSLSKPPVPWGLRTLGKGLGKGVEKAWLNKQLATHTGFMEAHLKLHPWFAGQSFSMADIQMSFPIFALLSRAGEDMGPLTQLRAWMQNVQARPAWQRALSKGGPFTIPGS